MPAAAAGRLASASQVAAKHRDKAAQGFAGLLVLQVAVLLEQPPARDTIKRPSNQGRVFRVRSPFRPVAAVARAVRELPGLGRGTGAEAERWLTPATKAQLPDHRRGSAGADLGSARSPAA